MADQSPIVVYSLAVGIQYVPSLRLSWLKQRPALALAEKTALNSEVDGIKEPFGLASEATDAAEAPKRSNGVEAHVQAVYGSGLSSGRDGRLQALALQKRCHKLRAIAQSSHTKAAVAAAVEEPSNSNRGVKPESSSSSRGGASRSIASPAAAVEHLSEAELVAMRAARCFIAERRQHWQAQDELAIASLVQPETLDSKGGSAKNNRIVSAPSKVLPKGRKLGSSYTDDAAAVPAASINHQKRVVGSRATLGSNGSSSSDDLRQQRLNHVLRLHVAKRKSLDLTPSTSTGATGDGDGDRATATLGWVSNARLRRFYPSLPPSGARRYSSRSEGRPNTGVAHPDAVMVGSSASSGGESSLSPFEEELLAELRAVSNASAASERWQSPVDNENDSIRNNKANLLECNEDVGVDKHLPSNLAYKRAVRFGFTPLYMET